MFKGGASWVPVASGLLEGAAMLAPTIAAAGKGKIDISAPLGFALSVLGKSGDNKTPWQHPAYEPVAIDPIGLGSEGDADPDEGHFRRTLLRIPDPSLSEIDIHRNYRRIALGRWMQAGSPKELNYLVETHGRAVYTSLRCSSEEQLYNWASTSMPSARGVGYKGIVFDAPPLPSAGATL